MARHPTSASYITPSKADGTLQVESAATFGRGAFTLASSTTYFFPIGGQDAPWLDAHCQWDSSIVITSIAVETCGFPESDVSDTSTDGGAWIKQNPSTAFVGTDGAGVTVASGVVAVAGGAQGGCDFQMAESCGRRCRLAVAVGATGGAFRTASWGKE